MKGHMVPDGPCDQAYPGGLKWGVLIDCDKTKRHWKHQGVEHWVDEKTGEPKSAPMQWWGRLLTDEEQAEAARLRAMGGEDNEKRLAWLEKLQADWKELGL